MVGLFCEFTVPCSIALGWSSAVLSAGRLAGVAMRGAVRYLFATHVKDWYKKYIKEMCEG